MFYSLLQGRLPYALFAALTRNNADMARLSGYLGAMR